MEDEAAAKLAEQPPDLEKLPNFEAFKNWLADNANDDAQGEHWVPRLPVEKWIAKLEAWCEAAMEAMEGNESRINELEDQVNHMEHVLSEMADAEESLKTGVERVLDFRRGICDPEEVVTWALDNEGWLTLRIDGEEPAETKLYISARRDGEEVTSVSDR